MKSCACVCMIQAPNSIRVIFMSTEVKRSKKKKIAIFRLRFISPFMEGKSNGCLFMIVIYFLLVTCPQGKCFR